jgi:DNA-binding NtrC family response regulator
MSNPADVESLTLDDLEYTLLMGGPASILIVDDEPVVREMFEFLLTGSGYQVSLAADAEEALESLENFDYNLLIVDKNLPGLSGLELMEKVRELRPQAEFMVITGYASYQSAVEALRLGALDYLEKPFEDIDLIKKKIDRAVERQRLLHENAVLADHLRTAHKNLRQTVDQAVYAHQEQTHIQKIEHQLVALRQAAIRVANSLKQACERFSAMAVSSNIPRNTLEEIRGLLEGAWKELENR